MHCTVKYLNIPALALKSLPGPGSHHHVTESRCMDGASPSTDPSNMTETAAELGPCCVYYFVPVKVKVEAEAGLIRF